MNDVQLICITVAVCWLSTLAVVSLAVRWHKNTRVTIVKKVEVAGK